jgi:hypothetical protein
MSVFHYTLQVHINFIYYFLLSETLTLPHLLPEEKSLRERERLTTYSSLSLKLRLRGATPPISYACDRVNGQNFYTC